MRAGLALAIVVAVVAAGCGAAPGGGVSSAVPSPSARAASSQAPASAPLTPSSSPAPALPSGGAVTVTLKEFPVARGQRPHDVWPAVDGGVWYTAQGSGELGWLDPATGKTKMVALGAGSAPHGVIVGPDGAPWITDGGLNAIVRVDPKTMEVKRFPLPDGTRRADLNTAAFAPNGILWFTGQAGIIGRLDPRTGDMKVADAPRGAGPYGITVTPSGGVYFASLAGSYLGYVSNPETLAVTQLDPPTKNAGPRRVLTDANGTLWIAEWNGGMLGRLDVLGTTRWKEYPAPGANPMVYAVYADERGAVWATQWGANALIRFDPGTEKFDLYPFSSANANVRQLAGRAGEVWGAESGVDKLLVATFR